MKRDLLQGKTASLGAQLFARGEMSVFYRFPKRKADEFLMGLNKFSY